MRLLRLLTFVFLFCVDVHVKAAELGDCWGHRIPCAVKAGDRVKTLSADNLRVSMSRASLLEQRDEKTVQLVAGQFYVETSRPVQFQTPFGKMWCESECKGLFVRETSRVVVKSFGGSWLVQRTGEQQTYVVPPALQVELGEVTSAGQAQMEFPQSLPWTSTVGAWAALYPGTLAEFKQTLAKFRPVWKEAVEAASSMHSQVILREIASDEKVRNEARARQLAKEREDQSLRQLFRDKNP